MVVVAGPCAADSGDNSMSARSSTAGLGAGEDVAWCLDGSNRAWARQLADFWDAGDVKVGCWKGERSNIRVVGENGVGVMPCLVLGLVRLVLPGVC